MIGADEQGHRNMRLHPEDRMFLLAFTRRQGRTEMTPAVVSEAFRLGMRRIINGFVKKNPTLYAKSAALNFIDWQRCNSLGLDIGIESDVPEKERKKAVEKYTDWIIFQFGGMIYAIEEHTGTRIESVSGKIARSPIIPLIPVKARGDIVPILLPDYFELKTRLMDESAPIFRKAFEAYCLKSSEVDVKFSE